MSDQLQFKLHSEQPNKAVDNIAFLKSITSRNLTLRFNAGDSNIKTLRWAFKVAKGNKLTDNSSQFIWTTGARKSLIIISNNKDHVVVNTIQIAA